MNQNKTFPLFYFSGTGGCLATAKEISKALPDFTPVPIAAHQNGYEIDADAVGFVFPLYFAGLPRIVANFIKKSTFTRPCYIFAAVACGFPWSGYALHQLKSLLKKSNQKLSAGFYIAMVDNYLPHYDVPNEEKLNKIYIEVEQKIASIVSHVQKRDAVIEREQAIYLYAMYPYFINALKRYDKHFSVDERCNGCGQCQKVCPVNNIKMTDAKPEWQHECEFCLACTHLCPQQAIQWKNVTQSKGRYRFKGITASDIAKQKQS